VSAKSSFMSKLPYIVVYIGVIAVFGVGVYMVYNKYQENEKRKIEDAKKQEIAIKKEEEENAAKQLQADIEHKLAVAKRKEEAFNKAVQYARENMDKPALVEKYYLSMKEFVKGSEFEALIDEKIAEIKESAKAAATGTAAVKKLDPESERLMKSLETRAKPYIDENAYMEAIAIYRDYKGPLKDKTSDARQQVIDRLYKTGLESEQELDIAKKKLKKQLDEIGDYIIEGKVDGAVAKLEGFLKDKELAPVKGKIENAILNLKNIEKGEKILEESLRLDINKTVLLETWGGKLKIEVKGIKNGKIFYISKVGNTKLKESMPLSILNASEHLKRLSKMNSVEKYLYAGLNAYRHNKIEEAKEYFAKTGIFSQPILEAVGKIELKKLKKRLD